MATKLTLLACAATAMARAGGFAGPDEPLDTGGRSKAETYRFDGPKIDRLFVSPSIAAGETAKAMGLDPSADLALADADWGAWTGRSLAEVAAMDAEAFARWLAAPETGAPTGESLAAVAARLRPWLDARAAEKECVLGVTHPTVVRACLVAAIGIPPAVAARIDVAPLSRTVLSFNRVWRLQALIPA